MYFVLLVCLGVVSPDLRVHWAVLVKYVFCIIGVVCLGVVSPDLRVHWVVLVKCVFCIIGVFGSSQP